MKPTEDLMLALLPSKLPGIKVQSLIEAKQTFPLVTARKTGDWGEWAGDPRFLDAGQLTVECFCEGINADADAAKLSEAVRVVLYGAINEVVPDKGYLTKVKLTGSPHKVSDWATAAGPVQYADLPHGVVRYESIYQIEIRKPRKNP